MFYCNFMSSDFFSRSVFSIWQSNSLTSNCLSSSSYLPTVALHLIDVCLQPQNTLPDLTPDLSFPIPTPCPQTLHTSTCSLSPTGSVLLTVTLNQTWFFIHPWAAWSLALQAPVLPSMPSWSWLSPTAVFSIVCVIITIPVVVLFLGGTCIVLSSVPVCAQDAPWVKSPYGLEGSSFPVLTVVQVF